MTEFCAALLGTEGDTVALLVQIFSYTVMAEWHMHRITEMAI